MKLYVHTFKVIGRGAFPLDMLRYDECYPTRGQDVDMLDPSSDSDEAVQLRAVHHRTWEPCAGRWESFGWEVTSHEMVPHDG